MRTEQGRYTAGEWTFEGRPDPLDAQLVLLFGGTDPLRSRDWLAGLRRRYPDAVIAGSSTAGEILDVRVFDDSIVATAICFDATRVSPQRIDLDEFAGDSAAAGRALGELLDRSELRHVLLFSDGLNVNGTDLLRGLAGMLPPGVNITGGLAGDGARFQETLVVLNEQVESRQVLALGLHGTRLRVGYASLGGWDPFGPERMVTRSSGNVLYQLDGESALRLYKTYLGEHAQGLPATGLLFPLALRRDQGQTALVRTILGVDETHQSMTFAGDVPEGSYVRLMRANFDRLIEGAAGAAQGSALQSATELALLISCVGRKMVLKQRVEEEVEAVRDILGPAAALTGFYSYGEISPLTSVDTACELHNQTMTITTLAEA